MKHLQNVQSDSEAIFKNYNVAYLSQQSKKIFFKKYYENPSIVITNDEIYNDFATIALKAKKLGVNDPIVWSLKLLDTHTTNTASLTGNIIEFNKHYEGNIQVTATAGTHTATKTFVVQCADVPVSREYSIVSEPKSKYVESTATSAEITFKGKIKEVYEHHHKDKEVEETITEVVNFTAYTPDIMPTIQKEEVDLGLPSGTKWAKCNLCAQSESESGYYFQWGDINGHPSFLGRVPKTGVIVWNGINVNWEVSQRVSVDFEYYWTQTPFNNGASSNNSSYFSAHRSEFLNGNILKPEYDAATQLMGEGWCMPTKEDFDELLANTTRNYTTINGTSGFKFTSKKEGYKDKYIFIPTVGRAYVREMQNTSMSGFLWSSTIYSSPYQYAWHLLFMSNGCSMSNVNYRCMGCPVRGVRK